MSQTLDISLVFSFRGETFHPRTSIDFNHWMHNGGNPEQLHHMLAESIGFGPYSHEYDVLMMSDIEFSSSSEWINQFIIENKLDFRAIEIAWREQQVLNRVMPIAEKLLDGDLLEENPVIIQALVECYQSGQLNPDKQPLNEEFYL